MFRRCRHHATNSAELQPSILEGVGRRMRLGCWAVSSQQADGVPNQSNSSEHPRNGHASKQEHRTSYASKNGLDVTARTDKMWLKKDLWAVEVYSIPEGPYTLPLWN